MPNQKTIDLYNQLAKEINFDASTDADKIKLKLMKKFSFEELEPLIEYMVELKELLLNTVEIYKRENRDANISIRDNDSSNDLAYQIVSEGIEAVEKYKKDPLLMSARYDMRDYVESFIYCFPSSSDYSLMSLDYYVLSSDQLLEAITNNLSDQNDLELAKKIIKEIKAGHFNNSHSYDELCELGKKLNVGAWLGNIWLNGKRFYTP